MAIDLAMSWKLVWGSDPNDSHAMPLFDIYAIAGTDEQKLMRQTGFDGVLEELAVIGNNLKALDFTGNGELWVAAADLEDGGTILTELDRVTFAKKGNSQFLSINDELLDIQLSGDRFSLHRRDVISESDGEESVQQDGKLVLAARGFDQMTISAQEACGTGLTHWHGQPLFLNDCRLSRYDYDNSGLTKEQVALTFGQAFADNPRVLALDEMALANGLVALVEDEQHGETRKHLGFIDMESGEVIKLGNMPLDTSGITVKFRDFESKPRWPKIEPPS